MPQGFTHGTLVAVDLNASHDFYTQVLGLEVHRFKSIVIYVKHREQNLHVCAERKNFKVFSPNFRNTMTVESRDAVKMPTANLANRARNGACGAVSIARIRLGTVLLF